MKQLLLKRNSHHKTTMATICVLVVLVVLHTASAARAQQKNDAERNIEYRIKAAFLFNFVKFVDWPAEKEADNEPIIIGIIGEDPFGGAFEPIKNKQVKGRKTSIKRFKSYKELEETGTDKAEFLEAIESLKECHLLFICSSEKEELTEIITLAQNNNILTVGEATGLLESGGIVKFLTEKNKVRFEINLIAAKQTSLTVRSQLLRLAKRVIEEEASD